MIGGSLAIPLAHVSTLAKGRLRYVKGVYRLDVGPLLKSCTRRRLHRSISSRTLSGRYRLLVHHVTRRMHAAANLESHLVKDLIGFIFHRHD